ncbi:MAG: hypothetical protein AAFX54_10450 [Pseudomonadota bacterium]
MPLSGNTARHFVIPELTRYGETGPFADTWRSMAQAFYWGGYVGRNAPFVAGFCLIFTRHGSFKGPKANKYLQDLVVQHCSSKPVVAGSNPAGVAIFRLRVYGAMSLAP